MSRTRRAWSSGEFFSPGSVKPIGVEEWLQAACDRFVNLSGLFCWHGRIRRGFRLWFCAAHFDVPAKTGLKLVSFSNHDSRRGYVFEKSPGDALYVRQGHAPDLISRGHELVYLHSQPVISRRFSQIFLRTLPRYFSQYFRARFFKLKSRWSRLCQ